MALAIRPVRLCASAGLLLLAACNDDAAYDKAIAKQHAQAAAAADAYRQAREDEEARLEAEQAERTRVELAFESDTPALRSEADLKQVLGYYCGDCHFPVPCSTCEWWPHDLSSLDEMLRDGVVIPGNAEGSSIVEQMRKHTVSLPDGIPAVSDVAITLVVDFINQLPKAAQ